MNRLKLLLVGSVALNVALIVLLALLRATTPGGPSLRSLAVEESRGDPSTPRLTRQISTEELAQEFRRLHETLLAAGFSDSAARRFLTGAAMADWLEDANAIRTDRALREYWLPGDLFREDLELFRATVEARRLRETALADALGETRSLDPWNEARKHLPPAIGPATVRAVVWLEEDYQLLFNRLFSRLAETALPEDLEALRLLEEERRRDLASLLSPAELEFYELRASETADALRHDLRFFDPSEEEFRKIFRAIQSGPTATGLEDQLRQLMEPSRFQQYLRATDPDYQYLHALTERLSLPRERAHDIYRLRVILTEQVEEILDDPDLSGSERADAMRLLHREAHELIQESLGPDGSSAYLENSGWWLRQLELKMEGAAILD
jgi:hypothetical protein